MIRNKMRSKTAFVAVAAVILVAGGAVPGTFAVHAQSKKPAATPATAPAQKATITINHGYEPASVSVKAGRPVELTLVRKEASGCGDVVQFPSLGIKRALKPGEKTVVKFTPKKSGSIGFACGMNMYRGQVVVK